MDIEVITNESGDWVVLKVDGKPYYEGHDIPTEIWLDLLEKKGCNSMSKEITDEEMESGNY